MVVTLVRSDLEKIVLMQLGIQCMIYIFLPQFYPYVETNNAHAVSLEKRFLVAVFNQKGGLKRGRQPRKFCKSSVDLNVTCNQRWKAFDSISIHWEVAALWNQFWCCWKKHQRKIVIFGNFVMSPCCHDTVNLRSCGNGLKIHVNLFFSSFYIWSPVSNHVYKI
jgi:hypothetical protein